jgi:hypothetical protein
VAGSASHNLSLVSPVGYAHRQTAVILCVLLSAMIAIKYACDPAWIEGDEESKSGVLFHKVSLMSVDYADLEQRTLNSLTGVAHGSAQRDKSAVACWTQGLSSRVPGGAEDHK